MFNRHKNYFQKKIQAIQYMVWDLEFKKYKNRQFREQVREEHAVYKARLADVEAKITAQAQPGGLKETDPDEYARFADDKVRLERDIKNYEQQMENLDIEVAGKRPTMEEPEGINGVNQQLTALHDLKSYVKAYIKTL